MITQKNILIIGDGCIDVFQYGICKRLSPEAPVPVFIPTTKRNNGGMAINVYQNILVFNGVEKTQIITSSATTKTRLVDEISNQMLLRVDENDVISGIDYNRLNEINFESIDAIIISDYDKGFLNTNDIEFLLSNAKQFGVYSFIDTKKKIGSWIKSADFIKINKKEFEENGDWLKNYDGDLIVTLGKDGALVTFGGSGNKSHHKNEHELMVRDVSGAGDSFLAGFVISFLQNNNIGEAVNFANRCAGYVVSQKGVVVIDPEKI